MTLPQDIISTEKDIFLITLALKQELKQHTAELQPLPYSVSQQYMCHSKHIYNHYSQFRPMSVLISHK